MRNIIRLVFLTFCSYSFSQNTIEQDFISPNKEFTIQYIGADKFGTGTYYLKNNNSKDKILETYFRYGPIVNWITGSIIEFRIPTENPNFHSFIYDCTQNKLSKKYNLIISIKNDGQIAACLNENSIDIYDIFSGSLLVKKEIPHLEPLGFLLFCSPKGEFSKNNTFILHWYNPDEKRNKDIEFPIDHTSYNTKLMLRSSA